MTLARRLAEAERRQLARAVAAFRRTDAAYDRAVARQRADPEHEAHVRAELEAAHAGLPAEERERRQRDGERMVEAMELLGRPGATDADVDRAVRLLEPLVRPRASPPYAIVGAARRALLEWLAAERAGGDG